MGMLENHNIICIAPNPWTDLWRRRQQLMSRFARKGRVLYIEPQRSLLTPFLHRHTNGWDLDFRFGLRQESDNLYLYSPFNPLPFSDIPLFDRINNAFVPAAIQRVVRRLEMKRPILWLYYTSKTAANVKAIRQVVSPRLICYDCYDYYAGYAYVTPRERPRILAEERELVQMADVVFVVSEQLYADKRPLNANTFLVPNGVDIESYERHGPIPEDVALIPHPIVGFTGKIAGNKIDIGLIRYLVESRPQWSVVLVGPIFPDLQRVMAGWPKYANLYILGQKPPWELPAYLRAFDVCIVPYLHNEERHYCDPLKVYEYLAAGKPIVATGFPLAPFLSDLVRVASSSEEFVTHIEGCLRENDEALARQRVEVARHNSWDRRVEEIEEILASLSLEGA